MITLAQIDAGKSLILDRAFLRYTDIRDPLIRIALQSHRTGTAAEQEVAKHILQEAYQAIFGISPIGRHHFIQWLRQAAEDVRGDDPTTGIDRDECFVALPIAVT